MPAAPPRGFFLVKVEVGVWPGAREASVLRLSPSLPAPPTLLSSGGSLPLPGSDGPIPSCTSRLPAPLPRPLRGSQMAMLT